MRPPKILVTGATGRTGRAVVDELLTKDVPIRAVVHSKDARSAALERKGVRMNRENIRTPARSIANLEFHHTTDETNEAARKIVAALERMGVRAVNGGAAGFPMEADRIAGAPKCGWFPTSR